MDSRQAAGRLGATLRAAGRPERATAERRYLKSGLIHYGVAVPEIRALARSAGRDLDREEILDLASGLWAEPVHELRMLAALLLAERVEVLEPVDLPLIERLIGESQTWALVDVLAPSVAGPLIDRHPEAAGALDEWAAHPDVWLRRAALLAELRPLRTGGGDFERFARHADALLADREFFVRKAIGWVLRDTSRHRPDLVRDWVAPRTHRMSGVTIREAVRRLPTEDQEELMAAYRERRPAT